MMRPIVAFFILISFWSSPNLRFTSKQNQTDLNFKSKSIYSLQILEKHSPFSSRRMLLGFEFSFDRRNISTYDVTFFEHCAVIETKSDLIPSTLHENHEFAKYFCRRIEQTFMSFSISFFLSAPILSFVLKCS